MSRSARFALLVAVALSVSTANSARASFVSASPDPLLGGELVSSNALFVAPYGYVTFTIADIAETNSSIVGGNNLIDYTAKSILSFYSDAALTNLVTSTTFQGNFEIEVFNRTSFFQTGSFNFRFVSSTASGLLGGVPVTVELDPTKSSTGATSISVGPGPGQYTIATSATQYSQFSVSGAPPSGIPAIGLVGVSAVPEPASLTMLGAGLVGLALLRRRLAA